MAGLVAILGPIALHRAKLPEMLHAADYRGKADIYTGADACIGIQQRTRRSGQVFASSLGVSGFLGWPYRIEAGKAIALSAEWLARNPLQNVACLDEIYGQYILFQLDRASGELYLLRDQLGSYPMHVMVQGDSIYLASDICQLAVALVRAPGLNLQALRNLHQHMHLNWRGPALYSEVALVPPGVLQCFSTPQRFTLNWPNRAQFLATFDSAASNQNQAISASLDALRISCAQAFAPNSALSLSGGMDSSLLALLAKDQHLPLQPYSAVFPGFKADESSAIDALVQALGVTTRKVELGKFQARESYEALCELSDYPVYPATFVATTLARLMATDGAEYLIDGNGGDELFDWPLLGLIARARGWRDFAHAASALVTSIHRRKNFNATDYPVVRHLLKRLVLGRINSPSQSAAITATRLLASSDESLFYLAGEQQIARLGLEVRSPFRDAYVIRQILPFMPSAAWHGGQRRALQSQLCAALSDGQLRLVREKKVNFDEFALMPGETTHALLGTARYQQFADLVPRFLAFKQTQGIKLHE